MVQADEYEVKAELAEGRPAGQNKEEVIADKLHEASKRFWSRNKELARK